MKKLYAFILTALAISSLMAQDWDENRQATLYLGTRFPAGPTATVLESPSSAAFSTSTKTLPSWLFGFGYGHERKISDLLGWGLQGTFDVGGHSYKLSDYDLRVNCVDLSVTFGGFLSLHPADRLSLFVGAGIEAGVLTDLPSHIDFDSPYSDNDPYFGPLVGAYGKLQLNYMLDDEYMLTLAFSYAPNLLSVDPSNARLDREVTISSGYGSYTTRVTDGFAHFSFERDCRVMFGLTIFAE